MISIRLIRGDAITIVNNSVDKDKQYYGSNTKSSKELTSYQESLIYLAFRASRL